MHTRNVNRLKDFLVITITNFTLIYMLLIALKYKRSIDNIHCLVISNRFRSVWCELYQKYIYSQNENMIAISIWLLFFQWNRWHWMWYLNQLQFVWLFWCIGYDSFVNGNTLFTNSYGHKTTWSIILLGVRSLYFHVFIVLMCRKWIV